MIEENFIKIYEKSFKENWDLPALTDYNTRETFTYTLIPQHYSLTLFISA